MLFYSFFFSFFFTSIIFFNDILFSNSRSLLSNNINTENKNWRNDGKLGNLNAGVSSESSKASTAPPDPDFQLSVPTSFQISRPNFYTEVNPMNSSSSPDPSPTHHPKSNFTHTANIDENYDI